MTDEEKQIDNTQDPMTEASEVPIEIANDAPMSEGSLEVEQDFDPQLSEDAFEKAEPSEEPDSSHDSSVEGADREADRPSQSDYQTVIATMTDQMESIKAQLEERTTQYMRIAADFDNFRKRTQKEKEDLEVQLKCATISELLPVIDNFERARSQLKPQTDPEMNIHKSYQSVYKQLVDCLKRRFYPRFIPAGTDIRKPLDLRIAYSLVINLEDFNVILFSLGVLVDTDNDIFAAINARLFTRRRLFDTQLRHARFNGLGHAALPFDLLDQRPGAISQVLGERFHHIGTTPGINDAGDAGLFLDD